MFPCSHVLHRHGAGLPDWVSDNSFRWRLRARSWNTDFLPSCPIRGPPPYFIRPLQYRGRISSVFDLGGSCLRWIQSFCGLEEWGPSMDLKRWVPLWTWRDGSLCGLEEWGPSSFSSYWNPLKCSLEGFIRVFGDSSVFPFAYLSDGASFGDFERVLGIRIVFFLLGWSR